MPLDPKTPPASARPHPPGVLIRQLGDAWVALQMPERYLIACGTDSMAVAIAACEWLKEIRRHA